MQTGFSFPRTPARLFTLVEMLVVLAIIGLLAAALMPSLSNAVVAARKISCLNNLRQDYMLLMQYTDDNQGWGPELSYFGYFGYAVSGIGVTSLGHYKDADSKTIGGMFVCPGATPVPDALTYRTSYCFTASQPWRVLQRDGGYVYYDLSGNKYLRRLSDIAGGTVYMTEVHMHCDTNNTIAAPSCGASKAEPGMTSNYFSLLANNSSYLYWSTWFPYHEGSANFLFIDGHVENHPAGTQFTTTTVPCWQVKN